MRQPLQQLEFQGAIRICIFRQLMMIKHHMKMVIVVVTCSDQEYRYLWVGTGTIRGLPRVQHEGSIRDCYETFIFLKILSDVP